MWGVVWTPQGRPSGCPRSFGAATLRHLEAMMFQPSIPMLYPKHYSLLEPRNPKYK